MSSIRQASEKTTLARILALSRRLGRPAVSTGGTLTRVLRKCGKPSCRCASDPEARHGAHILTWKEAGRTRAAYIPADMVAEVRKWTLERKRLRALLSEMDALVLEMLKDHAAASRAGRRAKPRPK
jgi:hypothetical protein